MGKSNFLIFHRITKEQPSEWSDVSVDNFNKILTALEEQGLISACVNEWRNINNRNFVLTFDDGYLSDFDLVMPTLEKRKMKGTFFISPINVGKVGFMTKEHILTLSEMGMEIGSHSYSHKYLTTLPENEIKRELSDSKAFLEDILSKNVNSFAYPYGDYNRKTNEFARELGYSNICTSVPGLNSTQSRILKRNSIHSRNSEQNLSNIANPSFLASFKSMLGYRFREALKKSLGTSNYLKLKKLLN